MSDTIDSLRAEVHADRRALASALAERDRLRAAIETHRKITMASFPARHDGDPHDYDLWSVLDEGGSCPT